MLLAPVFLKDLVQNCVEVVDGLFLTVITLVVLVLVTILFPFAQLITGPIQRFDQEYLPFVLGTSAVRGIFERLGFIKRPAIVGNLRDTSCVGIMERFSNWVVFRRARRAPEICDLHL